MMSHLRNSFNVHNVVSQNRRRLIRLAHTAQQLSTRKRKYNAIASPNEAAQGEFDRCVSLQMVDLTNCKRVDKDKDKHGIGKV